MTKESKKKNKTVFVVEAVLVLSIRKAEYMVTSISRREAHHVSVREDALHIYRKGSSFRDVLYHVSYGRYGNAPTRHPLCMYETDMIPLLNATDKV